MAPLIHAEIALFASRAWGTRGWIGAWVFSSAVAVFAIWGGLRWQRRNMDLDFSREWFWIEVGALATWVVALGLETFFLYRHAAKAQRLGKPLRKRSVGCLGFALGLFLCFLPLLLQDLQRMVALLG